MNQNAADLKVIMRKAGITREKAASLLPISFDTLRQWFKPETSRNANQCPRWAVELLALKTHLGEVQAAQLVSAAITPEAEKAADAGA